MGARGVGIGDRGKGGEGEGGGLWRGEAMWDLGLSAGVHAQNPVLFISFRGIVHSGQGIESLSPPPIGIDMTRLYPMCNVAPTLTARCSYMSPLAIALLRTERVRGAMIAGLEWTRASM